MSKKISYIKRVLRNKFFLASTLFVIWMSFFDPKDWGNIMAKKQELSELQKNETALKKTIRDTRKELRALSHSAESIERYARENYMMKRDNEEIFIVK